MEFKFKITDTKLYTISFGEFVDEILSKAQLLYKSF